MAILIIITIMATYNGNRSQKQFDKNKIIRTMLMEKCDIQYNHKRNFKLINQNHQNQKESQKSNIQ